MKCPRMNARASGETAIAKSRRRRSRTNGDKQTVYDEEHAVTYIRMPDAERASADWRDSLPSNAPPGDEGATDRVD
jgi:hypothetical protein